MKIKHTLLIVAGLLLCLYSCKKDKNNLNQTSIVGKWNVTKLHIQQQTFSTGAIIDTTYGSSNFGGEDYFHFNSDSTATLSASAGRIFLVDGIAVNRLTTINGPGADLFGYRYSISNPELTLTSTFINMAPPAPISYPATKPFNETILQLDATHLVLQNVYINSAVKTTTVTYYTRGQ